MKVCRVLAPRNLIIDASSIGVWLLNPALQCLRPRSPGWWGGMVPLRDLAGFSCYDSVIVTQHPRNPHVLSPKPLTQNELNLLVSSGLASQAWYFQSMIEHAGRCCVHLKPVFLNLKGPRTRPSQIDVYFCLDRLIKTFTGAGCLDGPGVTLWLKLLLS